MIVGALNSSVFFSDRMMILIDFSSENGSNEKPPNSFIGTPKWMVYKGKSH